MRRATILAGISVAALLATAGAESAMASTPLSYRVTIKNLTPNDLTPVAVVVHDKRATIWRNGGRGSRGLDVLARDGVTGRLLSEARRKRGVRSTFTTSRIAPGRSISFRIDTRSGQRRLSWASMLVATNDGFAGQSGLALPVRRGKAAGRAVRVPAWDAGAERNTESSAHVPSLGAHFLGPGENRRVRRHPGIRGDNDVPASEAWGEFAARIVIRPIEG